MLAFYVSYNMHSDPTYAAQPAIGREVPHHTVYKVDETIKRHDRGISTKEKQQRPP
jgi:hypothetical protein